ncbi:cation diffusion facilitator family transporter [Marinobacteraceae bacterium S3BR75-40.1]
MSDCCSVEASNRQERRLLWVVLSLNAVMFLVEFAAGWIADSSGLLADSLDMLADTAVYSLSLFAVGRALYHRARAALFNGSLQLALGTLVLLDVAYRVWSGTVPEANIMTGIALLALVVNAACFLILFQFRRGDINLRASWICSRNDMLANVGVLAAAGLVSWLGAAWPDRVIGVVIALVILHSAWGIVREARDELRTGVDAC